MAKKKVAHQAKEPNKAVPELKNDNGEPQTITPMDDSSEKLQNLKSLNAMLLKETVDLRKQVASLILAKEGLETELTRRGREKDELGTELSKTSEKNLGLELEKDVVFACVMTQIGQMGDGFHGLVKEKEEIEKVKCERESEIGFLNRKMNKLLGHLENEKDNLSRASRDRDAIKSSFDGVLEELNRLRIEVTEFETKEKFLMNEFEIFKILGKGLVEEKTEMEREIKELVRDKDLVGRKLEKSKTVIQNLKSEIEGIVGEKNELEKEKSRHGLIIEDLEGQVLESNGIISALRKENEVFGTKLLDLEMSLREAMEKEKYKEMEINALIESQNVKEKNVEMLVEQRDSLKRDLNLAQEECNGMLQKFETLVREKKKLEESKVRKESEILELQRELRELSNAVSTLKESLVVEEEKSKMVLTELTQLQDSLYRVTLELNDAQKALDDEKHKTENLNLEVSKKERRIREITTELVNLKRTHESLLKLTKEIEFRFEVLGKDKDLAEKNLLEARSSNEDLQAKLNLEATKSDKVLTMLKKTAELVCHANDDNKDLNAEEIEPSVAELDVIRNAFAEKMKKLEEMKQELELVKNKELKSKKLCSFLTTAAAILAATSAAFIAKGSSMA